MRKRWGIKWVSDNRVDGHTEYFVGDPTGWHTFRTRAEARCFRDDKYGYIRQRPDLQKEPFGWKLPKVVRVELSIKETPAP